MLNRWLNLLLAVVMINGGMLFEQKLKAQNFAYKRSEMELLDNASRLKTGDRLLYYVIEERESPVVLFINDRGNIKVPLIGEVQAVGYTAKQVAYGIKEALEVEFFHRATVHLSQQLADNMRGEITIFGNVTNPGKHMIPADQILYVSDAILRAGGFSPGADTDAVTLIRKDKQDSDSEVRFIVDVGGILATGKYEYDMPVEPDDLIIIPKTQFSGGQVYITGEVKTPGLYPIPEDQEFTVSRAILAAGGFTEWAKRNKVKLIRAGDDLDEDERTIIVDVAKILDENIRDNDMTVRPDDVIRVEESFIKL